MGQNGPETLSSESNSCFLFIPNADGAKLLRDIKPAAMPSLTETFESSWFPVSA